MDTELVRIEGIALEMVYSTGDNFTGRPVYPPMAVAYLCRGPALRLQKAQEALQRRGFSLKIWDAYRPHFVQKIFWDLVPDPRYVGDPGLGSKHNRGAAVDVTLVGLPMQSAFDDFSERAHRNYTGCDPERLANVRVLTEAMVEAGFLICQDEWWHFEDPDWAKYPILNIPFEEL